jgi:uncharacterized repeat protein (TIGR03837 family)
LVCYSYAADVFAVSIFVAKTWLLADFVELCCRDFSDILCICHGVKKLWYRVALKQHWDIFCKVVDNFGDIGICWRLAKQLQSVHGLQVRLWVDDLTSAKKIIPELNSTLNQQFVDEVVIYKWCDEADFSQAADVVIEAFACDLPQTYLAAMTRQQSTWVNLEYLSAEKWVDDFHGKPSPKPEHKLIRHFYFPGFTEKTGGLIREEDVLVRRNDKRGLVDSPALKISLFCYPFAPIHDLLNTLQINTNAVCIYVPEGIMLPKVAEFFGKKTLHAGDKLTLNNLSVVVLPFLSQVDYDALLCDCDLNFVRGEDSWIRAIWAGKPFIWQPYIQDENAHMKKLDAFLDAFYGKYDKKQLACEAHRYWSAGQLPKAVLDAYLNDLNDIRVHTQRQSAALANQQDLASKLVIFCNDLHKI